MPNEQIRKDLRKIIARKLGVFEETDTEKFSAENEVIRRVKFIKEYARTAFGNPLHQNGCAESIVLGVSGGVDSLVAGLLCQKAIKELVSEGHKIRLIKVRLPYGTQRDEEDANHAMNVIGVGEDREVNIKTASDAIFEVAIDNLYGDLLTPYQNDFALGNIKARQRMVAQYAIAGANKGLVVGTDHAAEAVMGFFTKHGDGAADLIPLSGLTKRQVRAVGKQLGAPDNLLYKTPTADLESLNPGLPDEVAFGVTYDQIDDFLELKKFDEVAFNVITAQYYKTEHKRNGPAAP